MSRETCSWEERVPSSWICGTWNSTQLSGRLQRIKVRVAYYETQVHCIFISIAKNETTHAVVLGSFSVCYSGFVLSMVEFSVMKHQPGILNLFEKLVLRIVQSPSDYARELILVCSKLALRKKETVHSRFFCINEWTMISCPSGYWSFFLAALSGCTILLLLPPPTHPWIECLSLEILF